MLGVKNRDTAAKYGVMRPSARLKLAKRIKLLRMKKGLTQEKLADLVGIDYKYIQKIEGKNPPAVRIDTIEKLADTKLFRKQPINVDSLENSFEVCRHLFLQQPL